MSSPHAVTLRQVQGYQFDIAFAPQLPALRCDEPPPLGQGAGPNPTQLLCAAVGNCMCDSLHFALSKFGNAAVGIAADVHAEIGRNAEGRQRVLGIAVDIRLAAAAAEIAHLDRILGQFEAFCTVGQSVAAGIPLRVGVSDAAGQKLQ